MAAPRHLEEILEFQVSMFMDIVVPGFLDDNARLIREYALSEYM